MKLTKGVFIALVSSAALALCVGCGGSSSASSMASSASGAALSSSSGIEASSSEGSIAEVKVPDLTGQSCDDAVDSLEALGLEADPISDTGKMVLVANKLDWYRQSTKLGTANQLIWYHR